MSGETSIATIRAQLDAANSYLIAWTAILYWDWLSTLPKEIEFIWRAKVTPLKVAFLAQRYGTLVFMATAATLLLADVPTSEPCLSLPPDKLKLSRLTSQACAARYSGSKLWASITSSCALIRLRCDLASAELTRDPTSALPTSSSRSGSSRSTRIPAKCSSASCSYL